MGLPCLIYSVDDLTYLNLMMMSYKAGYLLYSCVQYTVLCGHCKMLPLQIVELDLSTVTPSLSGPKRPHDRVAVSDMKQDFKECLNNKVGFKGFGIPAEKQNVEVPLTFDGQEFKLSHGKYLELVNQLLICLFYTR